MLFTLMMVLYVVLAVFLIGFILIQRGAGASAGSGFGGGASATVFGARGAASFLTKATKWLAIAFFVLTLGLAMYVQRSGLLTRTGGDDLGVMSGVQAPASAPAEVSPQLPTEVPMAPAASMPDTDEVPAAPVVDEPAPEPENR
jgi:preprotein translocase subunit SecG